MKSSQQKSSLLGRRVGILYSSGPFRLVFPTACFSVGGRRMQGGFPEQFEEYNNCKAACMGGAQGGND